MQKLQIFHYPENILRGKCQSVFEITPAEKELFERMLYTMKHASGIGLAAPQVGIKKNIIVADIGEGVIKLANPQIIKVKGTDKLEEGCLSVPKATVKVVRPYEIVLKGINEQGQEIELEAKGLLARVLLHEIDHLNGKLIVDYMNFLEKIRYKLDRHNQGEQD